MRRRPRGAALATLGLGLGVALAAARLAPLPGPLQDGVFLQEPHRWLSDVSGFALLQPGPGALAGASGLPAGSPAETAAASPAETPAASGEGTEPAVPQVTVYAGIAIGILLLGLLLVAVFPRRRRPRRPPATRPPPRTRR